MAKPSGSRAAGITKGGYAIKPYQNENKGRSKIVVFISDDIFKRINRIVEEEVSTRQKVIEHIIKEHFKAMDAVGDSDE